MAFARSQPKPVRERDPAYLDYIRSLPCIACACEGRETPERSVDAAHVSFLGSKGMGSKVSDRLTVALCRAHHTEQHSMNERIWWTALGIQPKGLCEQLSASYYGTAPYCIPGTASDGAQIVWEWAKSSRGLHRTRPASDLKEPADAAPKRVTVQGHLSGSPADQHGNVEVIFPSLNERGARGHSTAFIDPSAMAGETP